MTDTPSCEAEIMSWEPEKVKLTQEKKEKNQLSYSAGWTNMKEASFQVNRKP